MKLYVASSWRNPLHDIFVLNARIVGHEVYDYRSPGHTGPSRGIAGGGFAWSEIEPDWKNWSPAEFRKALSHPRAQEGMGYDYAAIRWCDALLMLQPSGRSAALELGLAIGLKKQTGILLASGSEPELMFGLADEILLNDVELTNWFIRLKEGEASR
jgi:hypothetical protein